MLKLMCGVWAFLACAITWRATLAEQAPPSAVGAAPTHAIAIPVRLPKAAYVTLVVEDSAGNRVRNLLGETYLPAGETTVYWDGYDDGQRNETGQLLRHRVQAGDYRLLGLTHHGIRMVYELTVNNPGTPPWATKDESGGWLADHSPPADILFLPQGVKSPNGKGEAKFLVCSTSAEAGSEFVWLDANGRRLFGANDGFWGGTHLARDVGPHPAPNYAAYVFESGQRDPDNFNLEVRGFRADTARLESIVRFPRPHALPTFKGDEAYGSDGVAVYNGRIVFAVTALNKLVFADTESKRIIGEVELPSPRGPAFDGDGKLLVLSGNRVKRFKVPAQGAGLESEETLVAAGLQDPRRLRVDAKGNIFISDWGDSHQVRVFNSQGQPVRTIGTPGGPQVGKYDERRMAHPCGVATDDEGQLWVAEGDLPKRISLWKADGSFIRAFYGPAKYGGGGALDPQDRSRLFYEEAGCGLEFAIDWATGTSKVAGVFWRPSMMTIFETMPGPAPERAIHVGGNCYLVNCYNGGLRENNDRGAGIWRLGEDGLARPVAMIGNGADLVNGNWGWAMKHRDQIVNRWAGSNPDNVLFVWCDRNGDGVAQPDEIQWISEDHSDSPGRGIGGPGLEPLIQDDLSFTTAYGVHVPPPAIDSRGVPLYDLERRQKVGLKDELRSPLIAGEWTLTHEDAGNSWVGADLHGARTWRHVAIPETQMGGPGAMVQPTRLLGYAVTPRGGDAGPVVAINGEMGAIFLLTGDGLFLQTLGGDARTFPPISEPNPHPGQVMCGFTFQQEHFHPTISQSTDGNIYLVAGFQQSTILRLDGFGSVKRISFGSLNLSEAQLQSIPQTYSQSPRKEGRPSATIAIRPRPIKVDGDLADWPADTTWMRIDERASAAIAVDAENLYVAFRTADPNALDNAGRDYRYLFKTGGGLDLMLGTHSEPDRNQGKPPADALRLLVTRSAGAPTAVLYRPVAAGAPESARVLYESPIGKATFDELRDVSHQLELASKGGDFEFSIPLSTLGLKPAPGTEILGDVGILRGSEGRTMQRVYWSNLNTTIVSDLPSEARLQPAEWGLLRFR